MGVNDWEEHRKDTLSRAIVQTMRIFGLYLSNLKVAWFAIAIATVV